MSESPCTRWVGREFQAEGSSDVSQREQEEVRIIRFEHGSHVLGNGVFAVEIARDVEGKQRYG